MGSSPPGGRGDGGDVASPPGSHVDVLPLRPRPRPSESLTGYLARLADANGVRAVDALSAICFSGQDRRIPRAQADYPPRSLAALSAASGCSRAALLGTTFYHLAVKFGRSPAPQPLSRFLAGSVAPHLRYCPACVAESGSHSLAWRFPRLRGCTRHENRLLDACGHCGQPVPLLAAPLRIGMCPACRGDLRTCVAVRLDQAARRPTAAFARDVAFLLAPRPAPEDDREGARYIGRRLGRARRARGLLAAEVAMGLSVPLGRVEGMERGNVVGRGGSFADYVAYADRLGLSIRDLFTSALEEAEIGALIDESTAIA